MEFVDHDPLEGKNGNHRRALSINISSFLFKIIIALVCLLRSLPRLFASALHNYVAEGKLIYMYMYATNPSRNSLWFISP